MFAKRTKTSAPIEVHSTMNTENPLMALFAVIELIDAGNNCTNACNVARHDASPSNFGNNNSERCY